MNLACFIVAACLLSGGVALAGQGRQTLEVESDFSRERTCSWLESHMRDVEQATGAAVLEVDGRFVTLEMLSSGDRFRLYRFGRRGDYQGKLVSVLVGSLKQFEYRVTVEALPNHRSSLTVTLTAESDEHNSVEMNVGLRKSLRLMRAFLEGHLRKVSQ